VRSSSFSELPQTQAHASDDAHAVDVHDASFTERRCELIVLNGLHAGQRVSLDHTTFTVGKGDDCGLVLADPTVSRNHFAIEQTGGAFIIRDRGSMNGTWIEDLRIREAWLRPGTVIRAGEVQLRFDPVFKPIDIAPSPVDRFGSLVGASVRMRQIFALLERIAKTEATVVIFGETGTGKSAVAQAIHDASPRRSGPFVTVDCGAIAENLIESELFGHEKGAFTGATGMRKGALERAQGGTLFIDELVDLRMDLQPRLLRVLEEREVRRVGGNEAIKLDVRVVAASRFDLWREVEAKRFREDLYFRLAVFTLPLPSLRERAEDIPLLARAIARGLPQGEALLRRFTDGVMNNLKRHPFPGNVRELRNVLERAATLDTDPTDMLTPLGAIPAGPVVVSAATGNAPKPVVLASNHDDAVDPSGRVLRLQADCDLPFKEAKEQLLEEFEAAYFNRLLKRAGGNASAMARMASIDRKHIYNLAKKLGVALRQRSDDVDTTDGDDNHDKA
jgi:DNA-binding NtrC family response regulator